MKKHLIIVVATVFALASLASRAQSPAQQSVTITPTPSTTTPSASPSAAATSSAAAAYAVATSSVSNTQALNYIHYLDELGINDANRALEQVSLSQAVTLAQTMLTNHNQNELQVEQVASTQELPLYYFQESNYQIAANNQLAASAGTQTYDAVFASLEVSNYQIALQTLEAFLGLATNSNVISLITQTIPIIQSELQLAEAVLTAAGVSTPVTSPSITPTPSPTVSPPPSPSPSVSPSPSPSVEPTSTTMLRKP